MKNFMSSYFSILFLFVAAASIVACNYSGNDGVESTEAAADSTGTDSTATFSTDSIANVDQLLDSLEAVK
jgi:hypothetical protein